MFNSFYEFRYVTNKSGEGELYRCLHIYRFRCERNQVYILLAEEYENNLYGIKFYLKAHADSDKKYQLMTNFYNAFTIFGTCLKIMEDIFFNRNPLASFIFSGAPTLIEEENKKDTTKRIKIYSRIVENLFSPINWFHYPFSPKNLYLLVNKKNEQPEIIVKWVTTKLKENFDF